MTDLLLLIESNTTGTGAHFVRAAREASLTPVLVTADASRYPFALDGGLRVARAHTSDPDALVAACLGLEGGGDRVAGVTSSSEYYVAAAADVARRLGLPGLDPAASAAAGDKGMQRERLRAAGVLVPAFAVADSPGSAVASAEEICLPVVVKPLRGSGSVGVVACASASEVRTHAERLLARTENERGLPIPRRVLVEELVSGEEYSVETFHESVVGITRKHLGRAPTFVETGHDFEAELALELGAELESTALAALRALNLDWGPAHVELRVGGGRATVIEVNSRLAGGFIPELIRRATGVDLVAATVAAATGRPVELVPVARLRASIRFLVVHEPAMLVYFDLDRLRSLPDLVDLQLYRRDGEPLNPKGDFRDRVGHVLTLSSDGERSARSADVALGCLQGALLTSSAGAAAA